MSLSQNRNQGDGKIYNFTFVQTAIVFNSPGLPRVALILTRSRLGFIDAFRQCTIKIKGEISVTNALRMRSIRIAHGDQSLHLSESCGPLNTIQVTAFSRHTLWPICGDKHTLGLSNKHEGWVSDSRVWHEELQKLLLSPKGPLYLLWPCLQVSLKLSILV